MDFTTSTSRKAYEMLEIVVFFGLVTNTFTLWSFPTKTLANGGVYFLAVYIFISLLVVLPLLHLEIFVGQQHQAGMCKIFRSFGNAFEGIGAVVFLLTFLLSAHGIQESYMSMAHIAGVVKNAPDLVTCDVEQYDNMRGRCLSIYDALYERPSNSTENVNGERHDQAVGTPVGVLYYSSLSTLEKEFDFTRCVYYFCVFMAYLCLMLLGEKLNKALIAGTYIVFIASHLITASSNIHLAGGTALYKALMNYSTPEALLSMNNCGVALWGVLAAASLHTNRRGSYELAIAMVLNNIIICVLSLLSTLGITAYMMDHGYNVYEYSLLGGEMDFYFGFTTDLFTAAFGDYTALLLYNIPHAVARLSRFFPLTIMVHAMGRTISRHYLTSVYGAAVTSCFAGLLLCILTAFQAYEPYAGFFFSLHSTYEFLIVAIMIILFVHWYGPQEHLIDICEVYPEDEQMVFLMRPSSTANFVIYDIVPFICIGFAATEILETLSTLYRDERRKQAALFFYGVVAPIPLVIVLVYYIINKWASRKRVESWMFAITPEHPSYQRINEYDIIPIEGPLITERIDIRPPGESRSAPSSIPSSVPTSAPPSETTTTHATDSKTRVDEKAQTPTK
ncbi:hypothetical protein Q1695_014992 [Nippostrongylus brasiliensis]|nr:hypothetical protein Q1695_014992 [Nippostrongylus brasiliensis]